MFTTIQENVTVGNNGVIQLHTHGFKFNSKLSVVAVIEPEEKGIEKRKKFNQKGKSLAGALKEYANPSLIKNEKDIAWSQLAKDKQ